MTGDTQSHLHARAALAALDPDEWTVLPDLRWPGQPFDEVDQVVVGPGGVFVVDCRPWQGRVTVRNELLRVEERSHDLYVRETLAAAATLAGLLPAEYHGLVRAVVCLTRQPALTLTSRGALVCGPANLVATLATGAPRLGPEHVAYVVSVIRAGIRLATEQEVVAALPRPRRPEQFIPAQRSLVEREPELSRRASNRWARGVFGVLVAAAVAVSALASELASWAFS